MRGGIDTAPYLGSRATFTLGGFGGHEGRALEAGDVLPLGADVATVPSPLGPGVAPILTNHWALAVVIGPHGAPDFLTTDGLEAFFRTTWTVHFNSARTGVRLIGPKPQWAREDGGDAGLHPSNIHDNGYAIGAVDITGDMPVILGPDGPSLGGFVCPAVVAAADRWKIGQLAPGDEVRLVPTTLAEAEAADARRTPWISRATERDRAGRPPVVEPGRGPRATSCRRRSCPATNPTASPPSPCARRATASCSSSWASRSSTSGCGCGSRPSTPGRTSTSAPAWSTPPPACARCSSRWTVDA